MDAHRTDIKGKYQDFETFNKGFKVDDKMMEELIKYGEKDGVKRDEKGLKTSGKAIRTQVKALIARQIFHNDGYFEVINEENTTFKKAVPMPAGQYL